MLADSRNPDGQPMDLADLHPLDALARVDATTVAARIARLGS
jgi:hypothetical protein